MTSSAGAPSSLQAGLFRQELCITLRVVLQEVLDDFVHQVLTRARELHPGDAQTIQKTFECGVRSVTVWDAQMRDQIRAQAVTKYRSLADLYQHCYLTFIEEMYGDTLADVSVRVVVPALSVMLHTFFKTACTDRAMVSGEYVTSMSHMGRVLFVETVIRRTMYELLIQHQNIKQMTTDGAAVPTPSLPAQQAPAYQPPPRRPPSLTLTVQPEASVVSQDLPVAAPITAFPVAAALKEHNPPGPLDPTSAATRRSPSRTAPPPSSMPLSTAHSTVRSTPATSPVPQVAVLSQPPQAGAVLSQPPQAGAVLSQPPQAGAVLSQPPQAGAVLSQPPQAASQTSQTTRSPSVAGSSAAQHTAGVRNYTSIPSMTAHPVAAAPNQPRRASPYSAHNPAGVEQVPSFTTLPPGGKVDSLDLCPSNEMFNDEIQRILGSAVTDAANDTFDSVSRLAAGGASRPPAQA
jgi:hypothetical protein